MRRTGATLLKEVAIAYFQALNDFERECARGHTDRADDALSRMQTIERSITVVENSKLWRAAA